MNGLLLSIVLLAGPVPSASPLPAEERVRLRAVLQWPQECEDEHEAVVRLLELSEGRVRTFELVPGRRLVEVGCARGAYQETLRYFLLDESATPPRGQALALPAYELDDDDRWAPQDWQEVAGEADFDQKRKTLTVFSRARGLGDCGQRGTWRFDAKSQKLALVEFRARACDDEPEKAGPSDKWPRVFPSAAPVPPKPPSKPLKR